MKVSKWFGVLAILAVAGCGGGGYVIDPSTAPGVGANQQLPVAVDNSAQLVGTWAMQSISAPAQPFQSCPATIVAGSQTLSCGPNETFVFHQDKTFTDTVAGRNGTFVFFGTLLSIFVPGQPQTDFQVTITGNTLNLMAITTAGAGSYRLIRQ